MRHIRSILAHKQASLFIAVGLCLLVIATAHDSGRWKYRAELVLEEEEFSRYPLLHKCSGYELKELYEILPDELEEDKDPVDIWAFNYHQIVDQVINEYMDDVDLQAKCDAEKPTNFLPAPPTLEKVAALLPPWEKEEDRAELSRHDVGPVLLELLRTYECALAERTFFLPADLYEEMPYLYVRLAFGPLGWSDFFREYMDQRGKIVQEISLSRPALNRVLAIVSTRERYRFLEGEVECLQRSSLDIRNAFGLSAEASSCLNRAWDAKDPLRDYEEGEPFEGSASTTPVSPGQQ